MANIMTKRGTQDNVITYEHICDTTADMANIESRYKTLGSVCIVIQGDSGGLEVYMMGSNKQWEPLSIVDDQTPSLSLHVCTSSEIDSETGLPDIDVPDENTFYFVASQEEDNNLYTEYIYVDNSWEKIGGATLDLSGYAPIANPVFTGSISLGRKANTTVGRISIALGDDVTASETRAYAEGYNTVASGDTSHAEGHTTTASGLISHAEGFSTTASSDYAHAEGIYTTASAPQSHAEGGSTIAGGPNSHVEGQNTYSSAVKYQYQYCSSFDRTKSNNGRTILSNLALSVPGAFGVAAHAEGINTYVSSNGSHAEGQYAYAGGGGGSHAEGRFTYAGGAGSAHAEGLYTYAEGGGAEHAEGQYTYASGGGANHVEGKYTYSAGASGCHSEGIGTYTNGPGGAHAEGYFTNAEGEGAHAEGTGSGSFTENSTTKYYGAWGGADHSEGAFTYANSGGAGSWGGAHAEGYGTKATSIGAHAEGYNSKAAGYTSHAEGYETEALSSYSHAEGSGSKANNTYAHAEGDSTTAAGNASHAEGYGTKINLSINGTVYSGSGAHGNASHAEGQHTWAIGSADHAEGYETKAQGGRSHAEGSDTTASGMAAHAEGYDTIASGYASHSEGYTAIASGTHAHAEGNNTRANASDSHAEGCESQATGQYSHAEGLGTVAAGGVSHVSGQYNIQDNYNNWQEWAANTEYKVGDRVKVTNVQNNVTNISAYICKTANSDSSFTYSKWTQIYYMNYAEIVGNGTYNTHSNARALDWDGNEYLAGDVYVGCSTDSTGGSKLAKVSELPDVSGKADKSGTVLETTLSRGRKADTEVGTGSLAFGNNVIASGIYSHAEGDTTKTSALASHAEGYHTTASEQASHAEGVSTATSGYGAHAEGYYTSASGRATHASGGYNAPMTSIQAWVAGTEYSIGDCVKKWGYSYCCKEANSDSSFDMGKWYEIPGNTVEAFVVGNGSSDNSRSNAMTLDWSGDLHLAGDVYSGANANGTGGTKLTPLPALPSSDGTYTLQVVISSGVPTYSWVAAST